MKLNFLFNIKNEWLELIYLYTRNFWYINNLSSLDIKLAMFKCKVKRVRWGEILGPTYTT